MSEKPGAILLLHNPGAGDESHSSDVLTKTLESEGYAVTYHSLKTAGWESACGSAEAVVVAGGDGTVRKVVKEMLRAGSGTLPPLGVLPLGTANNIANAMYGTDDHDTILGSWRSGRRAAFDVAWIEGLKETSFMIESLGFGVFPALIRAMTLIDDLFSDEPELRLDIALGMMAGIIRTYKPAAYDIIIDGTDHSGEYILVEIMNISSFGPNIELDANATPGDGSLDVILIPESGRQELLDYIAGRIRGDAEPATFPAIKGKTIEITGAEKRMHVDDRLIKNRYTGLEIELEAGKLQFLGGKDDA